MTDNDVILPDLILVEEVLIEHCIQTLLYHACFKFHFILMSHYMLE